MKFRRFYTKIDRIKLLQIDPLNDREWHTKKHLICDIFTLQLSRRRVVLNEIIFSIKVNIIR